MSIEEKRARVASYCQAEGCSNCVLNGVGWEHKLDGEDEYDFTISCLNIFDANESELDKAIELIEGKSSETKSDPINPAHYTDGKIEVIEYIEDKNLGFCLGNAIKYISRAGKKDPTKEIEDLKKAKWYIERRIKELEEAIECR